ncbi:hypothetical protein [Actinoplanes sp. DH11]|uniref:hypothetical protein n=1 Tax=Actinoplanes sp. DH11 TaxID=2857011 RepID=UPI001E42E77F|nr:hypothetical protein [Actinoplanes sp. DH11]
MQATPPPTVEARPEAVTQARPETPVQANTQANPETATQATTRTSPETATQARPEAATQVEATTTTARTVAQAETATPRTAGTTRLDPAGLWADLTANPAQAPRTLAEAAVRTLGPQIREHVGDLRAAYPAATTEALTRLTVDRFTRSAGVRGGLGAIAGPYAPIAVAGSAALTHAELVLHLAAIHGLDPADPRRADDIMLCAPAAVPAVVAWVALRLIDRALPGASVVGAVLGSRTAVAATAARARRHYTATQAQSETTPQDQDETTPQDQDETAPRDRSGTTTDD